ncbi:cardiolipin synthase [Terrilactibacillus tamarindi]|nr:cardiolipin synthase [Terrilactibacillus tamarindi]
MLWIWIGLILLFMIFLILAIALDIFLGYRLKQKTRAQPQEYQGYDTVHFFADGTELFSDLIREIESAKDYIHLSFFIFAYDAIGKKLIKLLREKAKDGVTVRLLVDTVGGFPLRKHRKKIKEAGIHLSFAAPIRFPFLFYYLNRRYHRKIAVIDGKVGYFGGFNVGDEYLGRNPERGDWQDCHLKLKGDGVNHLQQQFSQDWLQASGESLNIKGIDVGLEKENISIKLLATNGSHLEKALIEHLEQAKHSIFIGSPYFIPSKKLMQVLIHCLDRGVKLTILLPTRKDHPFVKPASCHYLKPLLKRGCELYYFYQGFYHSKTIVVDEEACCIGTANFDWRSFFWNDELSAFIHDKSFVKVVLEQTYRDIHLGSELMTLEGFKNRPLWEKIKTPLCRMLYPLL